MVIWSEPAKADLRHIFEYITHDSRHYANKVTQEIVDKTGVLNELPTSAGRCRKPVTTACESFPFIPNVSSTRSSDRMFSSWPWRINGEI